MDTSTYGTLIICHQTRTVMCAGKPVSMTTKDFDLATLLLQNLGRLMSRQHLMSQIWGDRGTRVSTRTLDTHIHRIRRKLMLIPQHGWLLRATYRFGYLLQRYEEKKMSEQEPAESKLLNASYRWWQSKRPTAWDQAQHLRAPAVNCSTNAEIALALAVAEALVSVAEAKDKCGHE